MKRGRDDDSPGHSSVSSADGQQSDKKLQSEEDELVESVEAALQGAVGMQNRLTDRRLLAARHGLAAPTMIDVGAVERIIDVACIRASSNPKVMERQLPMLEALYIGALAAVAKIERE